MKNLLLSVFSLLMLSTACNTKDDPNQQLQSEVIAVHDEVMPLMSTFNHNSLEIDSILSNLKNIKIDKPQIDTLEQKEKLTKLKNRISDANDAMSDWMHELNLDFAGMSDEEVKEYLEKERTKIENINKEFMEVEAESNETLSIYR